MNAATHEMLKLVAPLSNVRTTRAIPGAMDIRREMELPYDGGKAVVEWGVANTFFSAPAKATLKGRRGARTVYGFVSFGNAENGEDITNIVFTETPDRKSAKASYRESIRF